MRALYKTLHPMGVEVCESYKVKLNNGHREVDVKRFDKGNRLWEISV